jgi:hypothetical protein
MQASQDGKRAATGAVHPRREGVSAPSNTAKGGRDETRLPAGSVAGNQSVDSEVTDDNHSTLAVPPAASPDEGSKVGQPRDGQMSDRLGDPTPAQAAVEQLLSMESAEFLDEGVEGGTVSGVDETGHRDRGCDADSGAHGSNGSAGESRGAGDSGRRGGTSGSGGDTSGSANAAQRQALPVASSPAPRTGGAAATSDGRRGQAGAMR